MRWETRYSSAEMGYLEIVEPKREVVFYLNYPRSNDDRWSFEEFLAGKADYMLNAVYGSDVVEEVKAAIRRRL